MSDLKTKEEGVTVTSRDVHTVDIGQADDAAAFVAGMNPQDISEEDIKRVRRKIDLHVMPILYATREPTLWKMPLTFQECSCILSNSSTRTHWDLRPSLESRRTTTCQAASTTGLEPSCGCAFGGLKLTASYLSYLIFEWPQNLALQRFPPAKWMAGNIVSTSMDDLS